MKKNIPSQLTKKKQAIDLLCLISPGVLPLLVKLRHVQDISLWSEDDSNMYIGRFHPKVGYSFPWANPFKLINDHPSERNKVISNYSKMLLSNKLLLEKLPELLAYKQIGCWCAPNHCHGHVILNLLNKFIICEY